MAAPMKQLLSMLSFFLPVVLSSAFRKDLLSTKASYVWIHGDDVAAETNELMYTRFGDQSCRAVNVGALLRHGARQPGRKDIKKMSDLHRKLKLTVKNKQFSFIDTWENHFSDHEEKNLVDAGEDEHYYLGIRFGKRFFDLFDNNFRQIRFVTSHKQRTIDSAMAFYEGITESVLNEAEDDLTPTYDDRLLRFHEQCQRYQQAVENNRTHMSEFYKFKKSPQLQEVATALSQRLGMEHAALDAGELKLLYVFCAYELLLIERDDWCHLLTDDDREVIEYHMDMKQYWKKTYGHPVIKQMTCPLMRAIFYEMDKIIQNSMNSRNKRGFVGSFYFGHSETLAPLYAALGLFKDIPMLSSNYEEMRNRTFHSSQVLHFSANLVLVLFQCNTAKDHTETSSDDFVLQMFVNEKPVVIPACGSPVCTYKSVRQAHADLIDNCDFEKICKVERIKDEL